MSGGCVLAGLVWLAAFRARWRGTGFIILAGTFLLASIGIGMQLIPLPFAIAFLAALNAWDLIGFSRRIAAADLVVDFPRLERIHLRRLIQVDVLSAGFILLALSVHLRFSFGWIFFFALVLIFALVRLMVTLRNTAL
jgi:hypothetical protein